MTYLAKEGQVSGPFDDHQIQRMKDSGEFFGFEWMWDGQSPDWSPVPRRMARPPSLPAEATRERAIPQVPTSSSQAQAQPQQHQALQSAHAPQAAQVVHAQPQVATQPQRAPHLQPQPTYSSKNFPSVVYDHRQSVGGEISQAHARGGRFVSHPGATSHFPKGASVSIDVLDEQQDKSVKVRAKISVISRMDTRWVFDLEWSELPLL